jgi:DNA primase
MKDLLVLVSLGYNAVAPQSEAATVNKNLISELKSRFKRIVVLYDLDTAGFKHSKQLCLEHELECATLPERNDREGKDISDYRKQYGEKETVEILEEISLPKNISVKLIESSGEEEVS